MIRLTENFYFLVVNILLLGTIANIPSRSSTAAEAQAGLFIALKQLRVEAQVEDVALQGGGDREQDGDLPSGTEGRC